MHSWSDPLLFTNATSRFSHSAAHWTGKTHTFHSEKVNSFTVNICTWWQTETTIPRPDPRRNIRPDTEVWVVKVEGVSQNLKQPLTHCILGNFSCFFVVCWFFSKLTFWKNSFRNTIKMSNILDPDQAVLEISNCPLARHGLNLLGASWKSHKVAPWTIWNSRN